MYGLQFHRHMQNFADLIEIDRQCVTRFPSVEIEYNGNEER